MTLSNPPDSGATTAYFDLFDNTSNTFTMQLGKYKLMVYDDDLLLDFFYMDWRTSALPGYSPDVTFYYDVTAQKFQRDSSGIYLNISQTIQKIWELKPHINHITTDLQPYPPENINVTRNENPFIEWSHSSLSDDYVTSYDIYRNINTSGGSPGNFSLIGNVNQNTTSFSDIDLCGNGAWRVYY